MIARDRYSSCERASASRAGVWYSRISSMAHMKLHRLAALFVVACGSPQGLDEDAFPDQYAQGAVGGVQQPSGAAGAGVLGGGAGAGTGIAGAGSSLGNAGSPGVGAGGASGSGNVNPPAPSAGAGGAPPPAGTAGAGSSAPPPPPPASSGNACDGAPVLRSACGGLGCHSGTIPPDLASPGVEMRLVGVASNCNGLPYIGAGESFLLDKLDPMPPCGGLQMPLGGMLSADDRACLEDWAAEIGGGG